MYNQTDKNHLSRSKAFTLAEVLITLGIIGVIAALTIPTLITNYQKTQYVAGLKKFYSTGNSALKQLSLDKGCVDDLKCTGLFASGTTDNTSFGQELVKYFKVVKNCSTGANLCWSSNVKNGYDGSGSTYDYDALSRYSFITTDGMSVGVENFANDCSTPTYGYSLGYMTQTCGVLYVDVNGLKGPNYLGRDIFSLWITNGKGALLYPRGGSDDKSSGIDFRWNGAGGYCNTTKDGMECAGRIVEEGWEMKY